jgi:HPr kinase/phosphorylase
VLHGVLLEIFELGVLLTGKSGSGKSELALDLISRGHRLIADDTPEIFCPAPEILEGTCPESLRDFLEVRGLGILNIKRMFGERAIGTRKQVHLLVGLTCLEPENPSAETRLRGSRGQRNILNVMIPEIRLPICAGRNPAVLVECAVRDHILRLRGYHADRDLEGRLQAELTENNNHANDHC